MIKVYTDSTSYIPEDLVKKHGIHVFSLSVLLEDTEYIETQTSNEVFFNHMDATDELPKSSQPAVGDVYDAFKADIAQGNDIIAVFISSKMSGTFQTACMVRDDLAKKHPETKIAVIDSKANCMQLGLAALAAAEAVDGGASFDEAVTAVDDTIKRTRFLFIPKDLKYLEKGGRIGKAQALLGNILKLIPILTIAEGVTDSVAKVRTVSKAINRMIEIIKQDIETLGIEKLIVAHINALENAKALAAKLKEIIKIDVMISHIGPVVGAHVGPGSIGLIYKTKKEHPMNV